MSSFQRQEKTRGYLWSFSSRTFRTVMAALGSNGKGGLSKATKVLYTLFLEGEG